MTDGIVGIGDGTATNFTLLQTPVRSRQEAFDALAASNALLAAANDVIRKALAASAEMNFGLAREFNDRALELVMEANGFGDRAAAFFQSTGSGA